ncbi:MAG TPA: hypothetical protein VHN15_12450 [Thermoanaerobaculia bacterium]|nr:hypothetical protein [Thermoanaerobaculia bacterium]
MKRPLVQGLAALAAIVGGIAPVHAETVYVPLAVQEQSNGTLYRTEVSVTNPSAAPLRFTSVFIPAQDSKARRAGASAPVTLPAGGSFVLRAVAPAGQAGILEISSASPLEATARLKALRGGRLVSETDVPVISTADLLSAGENALLDGIAAGAALRLGVLNLSDAAASCSAVAYRADGTLLGEAPALNVAPRSHLSYEGSLTALRRAPVDGARLEVTCDAPFYAYAASLTPEAATFHAPASPGSDLENAVEEVEATSTGPGNLTLKGEFLGVKQSNSYRSFDLPLEPGVRYKRVTVDFDLYLHRWHSVWFHSITSLRRTDKTLFYGLLLKGSPTKTILDLGQHAQVKENWNWRPRTRYHVRMDYDVAGRQVILRVRQGGRLVHSVTGRMTNADVRAFDQHKVQVDFGLPKVYHHAYYPPYGSRFSNLKVNAVPF